MSKRTYGTGQVHEKHGAWYGRWRDDQGGRVNRRIGPKRTAGNKDGLTKTQAEAKLREMRGEEVEARRDSQTVRQAGAALIRKLELKGAKRSYIEHSVESIIRVHLADAREWEHKTLAQITDEDVERYAGRKTKAGLAPKTIRNHLGVLHSIFELGRKRRWCRENPVELAEGPVVRENETDIHFLSPEEVFALVRVPYSDDGLGMIEPTLYLTAALTGLRSSELRALRWRDVDWVARKIRVVKGNVRDYGEDDPKSRRASRSVPMNMQVAQALAQLQDMTPFDGDDDLVFALPSTGQPFDASNVLKRLRRAEERAGAPAVTFHELRHTFGTQMARVGTSMRELQYLMGHADIKTTQKYAHYAPSGRDVDLADQAFAVEQPDLRIVA